MNDVQQQTAIVRTFLKGICDVCLVPHDPEVHEATLRVRQYLVRNQAPDETGPKYGGFRDSLLDLKAPSVRGRDRG